MLDTARIERFEKMIAVDPDNELAYFSLARAYMDGGANKEAIAPLMKVIQLKPDFSKAYALLAAAQKEVGDREGALLILAKGYKVANDMGDLMPRNEMAALIKDLGGEIPSTEVQELTPDQVAAGMIQCVRCGKIEPKLAERPFSGPLGEQIHASVGTHCWKLWIGQGTKIINELRLNLTEPTAQDVYDMHMKEFLNIR
jgi:Fe-S cluster biosynthesis and repair protein YggX